MTQQNPQGAFKRHAKPLFAGLVVGLALLWAQNALANAALAPTQYTEITGKILRSQGGACSGAITAQERRHAIPKGLLKAISHAESGRWDDETKATFAWPWTVTTGGKGYYLPNRVDAVAFVKALQSNGVENIDVGCMQINLKYHPDAFATLEEAFDPTANAAYAAGFLKTNFAQTKSWLMAAGTYHSSTPERSQAYRNKIAKLWRGGANDDPMVAEDAAVPVSVQAPKTPFATQPVVAKSPVPLVEQRLPAATNAPADIALSQRFNDAFRARRTGGDVQGNAIANRLNGLQPGALASDAGGFATKRQAQLLNWRRDNGFAPSLTQVATTQAMPVAR